MELHGTLNMLGNKLSNAGFESATNFPASPTPGTVCFKDSILYFCTELSGGLPVWVPLTKTLEFIRVDTTTPALEWTIHHNLNTNMPFVQVYDSNGKWVIPNSIDASIIGQITVSFSTPVSGTCVLQRGATEGMAPEVIAFNAPFTNQDVWVVNHGLGYNPLVRVIVGNQEVQAQSIMFNSTTQLTVTFSTAQTGSVRCI